jgi:prepilin-type N-terminal cleavage/methylation domain-containing protein
MNGGKLALPQQIGVLNMTRVKNAFTMIEIIVVVIIISIAAMMAIPMLSSAGSTQARAAANMLAADLEYARSISITTGRNFSVVFDKANQTYSIKDSDGNIIEHPVRKDDYAVDFDGHDITWEAPTAEQQQPIRSTAAKYN